MYKKTLSIYFDFLSPFSYFLCQKIMSNKRALLDEQITLLWKPVVLAKLLTHWEIKAPAETPPKREYLFRQALRYAAKNKLPFRAPKVHPFNPLYVLRLTCISNHHGNTEQQEKTMMSLWTKIWGEGLSADNPEEIAKWLDADQLPGTLLLENSYQKNIKDQLKNNTQEAIDKKIFGVPSMLATRDELEDVFWGNDSYEDVISFLGNQDLLNREEYLKIVASTTLGASARLK